MRLLVLCIVAGTPFTLVAQDTLRVDVGRAPVWGDSVRLVEEVELGALEGERHEVFGRVTGVVGLADGTTIVADELASALYVFGPDGTFLRQLGRSGEGPGEFGRISSLAAVSGSRVAVQDVRGGRVSVYEPTGALSTDFRMPTGLYSVFETFSTDGRGQYYGRTTVRDPSEPPVQFDEDPRHAWVRYSTDGELMDSLPVPEANPEGPRYTVITPDGPRFPYTVETVSAIGWSGSIVWGRNDRYAIHWLLDDGRVVQLTRAAERLSATDGERQQFEQISSYFARRNDSSHPPVPSVKPFFRRILVDAVGRIWVERYTKGYRYDYSASEVEERGERPLISWREAQVFDVYEAQGRFMGTIRLPTRVQFMHANETHLWALRMGEYDEAYVVRYRIEVD